ncbi:MAG: hypothetical protein AB1446_10890 [Bacillota bacterium]
MKKHARGVVLAAVLAVALAGCAGRAAVTRIGDWREFSLIRERAKRRVASFALALEPERNYGWRVSALSDPCRAFVEVFSCGW